MNTRSFRCDPARPSAGPHGTLRTCVTTASQVSAAGLPPMHIATMNIFIPIGAGLVLATSYYALVQKLPVAWTILKIELALGLAIAVHYVMRTLF